MTTFGPKFEQYTKCCIHGCIHESQRPGELCTWHYMSNYSKKKHGKATVQQENDIMHTIAEATDEIPVHQLVKKLSRG